MDPQFRTVLMEDAGTRTFEENGQHFVEAMVCPFTDTPDSYRTTWGAGWCDESLQQVGAGERTIPMVFGHDERNIANIVGSVHTSNSTERGAQLTMRFADFADVPSARACWSLLKDGHLQGWSYKFRDGETVPDPNQRGVNKFTRARLVHVSPVVDPSVVGTHTISVRDADGEIIQAPDTEAADAVGAALHQALAAGHRSITITVGNDGTVTSHNDDETGNGDGQDDDATPAELAQAIDGAVDAAIAIIDGLDLSTLPPGVGQVAQLLHAADVAADELLEALGLPDPDDGADADTIDAARAAAAELEAERAAKGEPFGDVTYADPGYQKDKQKRYPIDTAAHVKSAWAFINQEKNAALYSAEDLAKVKAAIKTAAKRTGVEVAGDSGGRSVDDGADELLDIEVARRRLRSIRVG